MIIDCIADLHGYFPKLEGGDLLIVAGDLTARDTHEEYCQFYDWLDHQRYTKKIFICGNHDAYIEREDNEYLLDLVKSGYDQSGTYLCDSGTEFEGLKIWGSPWTLKFEGMNPKCMAFTCDTEEELSKKWALIPDDVDILVTHSPPYGVFDKTFDGRLVGSKSLRDKIFIISPKISLFGHIHEEGGQMRYIRLGNDPDSKWIKFVNASHVNEHYKPVNKPVRVIL